MQFTNSIEQLCISPTSSLRQAIETIQQGRKQIALVVDSNFQLLGTITDGDIRRALIKNIILETSVSEVMCRQFTYGKKGMSAIELLQLMENQVLRHLPLLDEKGVLVDLVWISDLVRQVQPVQQVDSNILAVVMAGGFGTRLRPLTDNIPKPMLPLGDKPILERTIEQLRKAGIHRLNITTHYLAEVITQHFGDGKNFGVDIEYVKEEQPLGTAGALSLLKQPQEPLLVMNGDIVTKLDFRALLDYHCEHGADMTVGVKQEEFQIPYGEVEIDGVLITGITEKPIKRYFINAGIYLLNPDVCQAIPRNESYDMPSLIEKLISQGGKVVSFPIHEYWLDIGKHPDYQKAICDIGEEML